MIKRMDSGVSNGGSVFGMTHTRVNPPANAALDPVSKVSLSSRPGSRKWTWRSQKPWVMTFPEQSIEGMSFGKSDWPRASIFPFLTQTYPENDFLELGSTMVPFFNKRDFIYSFIKFRNRYFVKKFDKKLKSNLKFKEITKEEITKKYNDKFTVIVKSNTHSLDEKIKKLNNSIIVDLDHNELEFLRLKGLLDKDLIKPLYLT